MYEETMKKAFMRGVCALNLEAMTMFGRESDDAEGPARHAFLGNSRLYTVIIKFHFVAVTETILQPSTI